MKIILIVIFLGVMNSSHADVLYFDITQKKPVNMISKYRLKSNGVILKDYRVYKQILNRNIISFKIINNQVFALTSSGELLVDGKRKKFLGKNILDFDVDGKGLVYTLDQDGVIRRGQQRFRQISEDAVQIKIKNNVVYHLTEDGEIFRGETKL